MTTTITLALDSGQRKADRNLVPIVLAMARHCVFGVATLIATGCAVKFDDWGSSTSVGGSKAVGGTPSNSGGTSNVAAAAGGTISQAGTQSVGGASASGGAETAGGATALGGSSNVGDTRIGGGNSSLGGGNSAGASTIGGTGTVGGASAVGGTLAPGGANGTATGGTGGAGGTSAGGVNGTTTGGTKNSGGSATGGAATGGTPSSGGAATGGVATGGVATGGVATGGVATGGAATGGVATGGAATGGVATGGAATGGTQSTGGSNSLGGTGTAGTSAVCAAVTVACGDTVCQQGCETGETCPADCGALVFANGSVRRTTSTGNWAPSESIAECGPQPMTGLSTSTTPFANAHAALCGFDDPITYPHTSCTAVSFAIDTTLIYSAIGDWDFGYRKGECAQNAYVAGVAAQVSGVVDTILCCTGQNISQTNCVTLLMSSSQGRESGVTSGDWDFGFYKAECGPGRYIAGVGSNSGTTGTHSILCCSP